MDDFDRFVVACGEAENLGDLVPAGAVAFANKNSQSAIPSLAKDKEFVAAVERAVPNLKTHHTVVLGDCRSMEEVPDESVHLVLTSPPYWTLKQYPDNEAQLGEVEDYDRFIGELDRVWEHSLRILVPGGRLVVVVGDVCLSRRDFGRHVVFPLHASIQEGCRRIGFDNLAPIIWHKIANAKYEVDGGGGFMGKPYEPNAVVKNDIEFILFQRKPGGYRQPSLAARLLSIIPEHLQRVWFQQIWTIPGASTRDHPAPYPLQLAERLVRMFSFVGDTVLDPFLGTGTTAVAASRSGRNSIGFEIEPTYFESIRARMQNEGAKQLELSIGATA